MGFMRGVQAFRNTMPYLNQGKIAFKYDVRVMLINYNSPRVQPGRTDTSSGIRCVAFLILHHFWLPLCVVIWDVYLVPTVQRHIYEQLHCEIFICSRNSTVISLCCRDMIFWHLNQIQFKNPRTQILTLKDMTPTPFLTFILGEIFVLLLYFICRFVSLHVYCNQQIIFFVANKEKIHVDVDGRKKDEILLHVREILGKSE